MEDHFEQWHPKIATKLLFDSYTAFCQTHRERHPKSQEDLGKWLRAMGYKSFRPSGMVVTGEHMVDAATTTTATSGQQFTHYGRIPELIKHERAHSYDLGTLDEARDVFTKATKLSIDWGKDDPEIP